MWQILLGFSSLGYFTFSVSYSEGRSADGYPRFWRRLDCAEVDVE